MKRTLLFIALITFAYNLNAQCSIDGITLNMSTSCASSTYEVSGAITFTNSPTTGTLDIVVNDGVNNYSSSIDLPTTSPVNYSVQNIPANGNASTITASFSAEPTCTANLNITSPICPCEIGSFISSVGECKPATNTYMISGSILFNNTPSTGTLTISVDDGINGWSIC